MAGFGGAVKLTGESEYRKALKAITDNLTVLSSEMKVVNSMYDKNDTSTDKLAKNNEVLSKKLDEQNKKLAEAKKMLDAAKNSTDSNAQTVAKWQNEVNKAQAEVNQTTKEIKDNTAQMKKNEAAIDDVGDELQDLKKSEDEAGKSAIKLGDLIKANVISQAIISGVKALGSAMVGLAKGAFNLGKQSIESFAEYEQLVGGVDTLFKESSGKVQGYANNAYKTAGLSANAYMETVTSFTASLLQSLDGDTAKSAEVADMAITDMADNANKMGTSMESIQNAYQGFAKQNYTMLDNLKLGYGGTKSEMERLLQDATAISGVEYDISNLNDVYQAIHVIQGELGITGTTAKEASETIQGSLSAMNSAWQNLLTGMADDNADFSELTGNFVESILTVADNILPRVQTVVGGIGELVSGLLTTLAPEIISAIPPMLESILPTLITAIETITQSITLILPQIAQAVGDILPVILSSLIGMLPSIADTGVQIILTLVDSISASLPTLIPAVVQAILTIVDNLISNIDLIVDSGVQLIMGLSEGLIDAIPILVDKIPTLVMNLLNAIARNLPKLIDMGNQLTIQLAFGLLKALPILLSKIPEIISGLLSAFGSYYSEMFFVGVNLLKGLWDGIADWAVSLYHNVVDLGKSVVGWFESVFGIHSPSKVFADKIGKNMALGIGAGFEDTMTDVANEMTDAIPTDFDVSATVGKSGGVEPSGITFAKIVEAFKQALKEVNIVLDDEVAGRFVTDTVEKVVYS